MNEALNNVFDVEPVEVNTSVEPFIQAGVEEDIDYLYARGNYYQIIEQGKKAVETALRVADETQNPRALEVLGNLLKSMSEINKQLVMMAKDKQDVKEAKNKVAGKNIQATPTINSQNTIVFNGSSSELNKKIKEQMLHVPVTEEINNENT